jgi:N-acetylmuramoyl-L-alanine amidase
MQPNGLNSAGIRRHTCAFPLLALHLTVLALTVPFSTASASDRTSTQKSAFPLTIENLIGATKSAFGLGPAKPSYQPTRLSVELERSGKFQVFSLSRPNRVVIEVPNVPMRLPALPPATATAPALIKSIRSGISAPGKVRIVMQVAAPVVVENARMIPPLRDGDHAKLSIEVVPVITRSPETVRAAFKQRIGSLGVGLSVQPPLPRPAETPKDLRARSFKPVIVIDPGHGGHDSGATKFGIEEKDVVLAFSLELREKLMATGRYRVLMTRSDDRFVTLHGRREFADKHKAALFIAVHADYANTGARGATVYSLREHVAERLKQRAKKEVARSALGQRETKAMLASAPGVGIVRSILTDLAKREVEVTKRRTDLFTEAVIRQMGETTTLRSQPHKSAGFHVIKTAKMPSVLIELAYISNRRDARKLTSSEWRNKVSASIARAVDNYFSQSISRVPM